MSYFERSQSVKGEIEESGLVGTIKSAFKGDFEPFTSGGTVDIYHIGRLGSGMYVALRVFRPDVDEGQQTLERQMEDMELYCQNSETLHGKGETIPAFVVGATDGRRAGILTEDLTQGGTVPLEHHPDSPYGFIERNGQRTKVWIDIDKLSFFQLTGQMQFNPELRYFSPKKYIDLRK